MNRKFVINNITDNENRKNRFRNNDTTNIYRNIYTFLQCKNRTKPIIQQNENRTIKVKVASTIHKTTS